MKYRVVFAPRAIRDLDEIFVYLASDVGATAAREYISRIRNYCAGFSTFPKRGTRRDDIRPGLRLVGYRYKATVAFDVESGTVTILRVFHRGRDVDFDDLPYNDN
jgi:toxin ParE1/3/4